jgi:hypothetical protein
MGIAMMEANTNTVWVASEWKRNNAPQKLLQFVEKLHTWRRG